MTDLCNIADFCDLLQGAPASACVDQISAGITAAITVAASGVVIDLEGFNLSGSAGPATEAIGILGRSRINVTVENGKVESFLAGVYLAGATPSILTKFTRSFHRDYAIAAKQALSTRKSAAKSGIELDVSIVSQ